MILLIESRAVEMRTHGEYNGIIPSKIEEQLFCDIWRSYYPNVYFINQNGKINEWNNLQTLGWKYYKNGGCVEKITEDYQCGYSFDFECHGSEIRNQMEFVSRRNAGISFLDFISSVAKADHLVQTKGLEVWDARKEMNHVIKLYVTDTHVDQLFLDSVHRYLKNLKCVKFAHCTIDSHCDFSKWDISLVFYKCELSSLRSLNDTHANIELDSTFVDKLVPTKILSKNLKIISYSPKNFSLKNFFLCASFPDLQELSVEACDETKYSYENDFVFLPYSAPNLKEICIKGKVKNFDFLTYFSHLENASAEAYYADFGNVFPYLTDRKKQEKIKQLYQEEFLIQKYFFGENDDVVSSNVELLRINKLCEFLSYISYTEDEKDHYMNYQDIFLPTSKDFDEYYECVYNQLHLKKQEPFSWLDPQERYFFVQNYLCCLDPFQEYRLGVKTHRGKQIVTTKNYMVSSRGIPILFNGRAKAKPMTLEQAEKLQSEPIYDYHMKYRDFLEDVKNNPPKNDIRVLNLLEWAHTFGTSISRDGHEFLDMGPYGKKIAHVLLKTFRNEQRFDEVQEKYKHYLKKAIEVLQKHYERFTIQEKIYLYFLLERDYRCFHYQQLKALCGDVEDCSQSVHEKTNGEFFKYWKMSQAFYKLSFALPNSYDETLKAEWIRKLEIK